MLRSQEGQAGAVLRRVLSLLSKTGAGTREKAELGLGQMKRDWLLHMFSNLILTLRIITNIPVHMAVAF